MIKIKTFLKYKNLYSLFNLISINYSLMEYKFIIFCSLNKAKNFSLLYLKNEIKKLNSKSFLSYSKYIKKIQNEYDLKILGNHILIILAKNLKNLSDLINLLNYEGIWFFFLHMNNLSKIFNTKNFEKYSKNLDLLFNFNFLIYRLIIRIFLILAVFLRSIFLLISFNKG